MEAIKYVSYSIFEGSGRCRHEVESGDMTYEEVTEEIERRKAKAEEMLKEKNSHHILYAVEFIGDSGKTVHVDFYMERMTHKAYIKEFSYSTSKIVHVVHGKRRIFAMM